MGQGHGYEDHQNEVHTLQRNFKVASQAHRMLQLLRLRAFMSKFDVEKKFPRSKKNSTVEFLCRIFLGKKIH